MVLVAAGLGVAMGLRHGDIAYLLVLIWALIGIAVRLHDTTPVLVAALGGATALALTAVLVARSRPAAQT